jgi:hypothetical protein
MFYFIKLLVSLTKCHSANANNYIQYFIENDELCSNTTKKHSVSIAK